MSGELDALVGSKRKRAGFARPTASALVAGIGAQYVSARSLQVGDVVSVTALTGLAVNVANILGVSRSSATRLRTGRPAR